MFYRLLKTIMLMFFAILFPGKSLPLIDPIVIERVGFFCIQFGSDLQRANMGPIYDTSMANADSIPCGSCPHPLTPGCSVQPVSAIGAIIPVLPDGGDKSLLSSSGHRPQHPPLIIIRIAAPCGWAAGLLLVLAACFFGNCVTWNRFRHLSRITFAGKHGPRGSHPEPHDRPGRQHALGALLVDYQLSSF